MESTQTPYDLICIGFGVSGLSIAIALQERCPTSNALFLERDKKPQWQPGLAIPGMRMRSSLLCDLVTARNPRSKYTFINYLHSTGQLMTFTNLGSLRAPREQFADYLAWCSASFDDRVRRGFTVVSVEPRVTASGVVEGWYVIGIDSDSGTKLSIPTRKVICAAGLQSSIPKALTSPDVLPSVFHSSTYAEIASQLQDGSIMDKHIAVIGGNQHAAEIFENLQTLPGNHRATLYIQDAFLYPDTDHAFTGDILQSLAGRYAHLPLELRRKTVLQKGREEPPTVDLALLERLYELQAEQNSQSPNPAVQRFRIEPLRDVIGAARVDGRVQLHLQDARTGAALPSSALFDVVITATGYEHTAYTSLLAPAAHLFDDRELTVGRDYAVNFRRGSVRGDAGVWVLGALASEDDVSSLFLTSPYSLPFPIPAERPIFIFAFLFLVSVYQTLHPTIPSLLSKPAFELYSLIGLYSYLVIFALHHIHLWFQIWIALLITFLLPAER